MESLATGWKKTEATQRCQLSTHILSTAFGCESRACGWWLSLKFKQPKALSNPHPRPLPTARGLAHSPTAVSAPERRFTSATWRPYEEDHGRWAAEE